MKLLKLLTDIAINIDITTILIFAFADWRLASLFANEDGPVDIFAKIRKIAGVHCGGGNEECFGKNWFAKGLLCEWCNSIWFGTLIVIAYIAFGDIVKIVLLPLSLSTFVIGWKYLVEFLQYKE